MIPGSNLLNTALRVIARQGFTWEAFQSRTTTSNRMLVPTYAPPVALSGSVQPVPRNLYQENGLLFDKNYITVFVSTDVMDIQRDVAGDKITFAGNVYKVESRTPWISVDGWNSLLCVQVASAG